MIASRQLTTADVREALRARVLGLDLVALLGVALVARVLTALIVEDPPYLDAAYYELVARRLVAGEGFSVPVIWSFLETGGRLPADPQLPVPSNGHWMPLTSILAAAGLVLFGSSRLAAEIPMVVLSVLLVGGTWLVAWEISGSRLTAGVSGLLAIFAGPLLVMAPLVDSFAIFGALGFVSLYSSTRAVRSTSGEGWLLLSGAAAGLATMARIDGLLLLVGPAAAVLVRLRAGRPIAAPAIAGSFLLAAVVLTPWLVRQAIVFGTPFPSAGGHTLWVRSYNEQFSIGSDVSLQTYLGWGLGPIIVSKLGSWAVLIGRTATLLGGAFVVFFAVGAWHARRRAELIPFLAYFVVLFAAMGGVFTFHAPQGAYYHSALAWLPFAVPIAVIGVQPTADLGGRWWPFLRRQGPRRFLLLASAAGAMLFSLVASTALLVDWEAEWHQLEAVGPFFAVDGRDNDVVMYVDPPSLNLLTGNPAVPPTWDLYPIIGDVAEAYDARWLIVEQGPGGTDPLGLWAGGASTDPRGNRADWLAADPAFEAPGIRVYAVIGGG
jgi:4-amino-4-deoxy-L-arabinose transferase-like glycosyltransferase